ncbi:MAG: NUDIX domain-containing protein [Chloroflexota bacterium]
MAWADRAEFGERDDGYTASVDLERTLSSRQVYAGRLIRVRGVAVELADGRQAVREIVEHPGAVAIVAITAARELVLVRQYRKAAERLTLEIPAGTLAQGEEPRTCAIRELKEETGYVAETVRPICSFFSAVGFCTELMHLFIAEGLTAGAPSFEEDESIEVFATPVAAALAMVERGEIVDAKTVVAVLWARLWVDGKAPAASPEPSLS